MADSDAWLRNGVEAKAAAAKKGNVLFAARLKNCLRD